MLPAHHLNIHHHSRLCLHNLLHHSHTSQITYNHTHKPKRHYNHLPLHNLYNSLLLGQILIWPPSLSFQLQRHINPCPAHHYRENRSSAPDGRLYFHHKQPGHLKKDCPEQPYCSKCRTRGHIPANALPSSRTTGQLMMDANFERKQEIRSMRLTEKNGKDHRINLNSHIRTTDVSTAPLITIPMIALQGYSTRLLPLATMLEAQVFTKTQINSQTLHPNIVHTCSNTLNKVNPLLV